LVCSSRRCGPRVRHHPCGTAGGALQTFRKACGTCQDWEGGWPRSAAPRERKHRAGANHTDSRAERALQSPQWRNPSNRDVPDGEERWRSKLHQQLSIPSGERRSFNPPRVTIHLYQVIRNCQMKPCHLQFLPRNTANSLKFHRLSRKKLVTRFHNTRSAGRSLTPCPRPGKDITSTYFPALIKSLISASVLE